MAYLEAHPDLCEKFKEAGRFRFYQKLQRFHQGVAEAFSRSYDGARVKLGPMELLVDEASVAMAIEMPREGEGVLRPM